MNPAACEANTILNFMMMTFFSAAVGGLLTSVLIFFCYTTFHDCTHEEQKEAD